MKVAIIGGGAIGRAAIISALEQLNRKVVVIEAEELEIPNLEMPIEVMPEFPEVKVIGGERPIQDWQQPSKRKMRRQR